VTKQVHDTLYWSEGSEGGWAIRSNDWKIVVERNQTKRMLFNLAQDPGEKNDVASQNPEKLVELTKQYDAWLDTMAEPLDGSSKKFTGASPTKKGKRNRDTGAAKNQSEED
jgi:arylsulfatase A-like enzyme